MVEDLNPIHELFQKHNYCVNIWPNSHEPACSAEFPERSCIKPISEGLTCTYLFQDKNDLHEQSGLFYTASNFPVAIDDEHDVKENNLFIKCPSYAVRPLIYYDILFKTSRIGLIEAFIFFKGVTNIFSYTQLVNLNLTDEDRTLEVVLGELLLLKLEEDEDLTEMSEHLGVEEGYKLFNTVPF